MKNFIAIALLVLASCTEKRITNLEIESKNAQVADSVLYEKLKTLQKHVNYQDSVIKVLALHAYHADSVSVIKQTKNDRAERRGKFLGGLLKTLIPGL